MLSGAMRLWALVRRATNPGVRLSIAALAVFFSLSLGLVTAATAGYDEGAAAFIRGDYETAWQEWLALGERGHQSAQYNLGVLYSIGLGVDQDYAEASKWFRRAADRGLPAAQMRLGTAYQEGKGVPEDLKEAYFWFTLAASHFSLGEQHDQAVAARERTGARLTRAQITEVLEKAMTWKPVSPTMDESEKERLIALPNSDESSVLSSVASDGNDAGTAVSSASLDQEQETGSGLPQQQTNGESGASGGPIAANAAETDDQGMSDGKMTGQATAVSPPLETESVAAAQPAATAAGNGQDETPSGQAATGLAATEVDGSSTQATRETANPAPHEFFAAHLSSVQSREGTEEEWKTLRGRYPELLDDKTLTVRTIEIPDKGIFYRVMAGTFDSYDAAEEFCTHFQASDQYCVVRHLSDNTVQ